MVSGPVEVAMDWVSLDLGRIMHHIQHVYAQLKRHPFINQEKLNLKPNWKIEESSKP